VEPLLLSTTIRLQTLKKNTMSKSSSKLRIEALKGWLAENKLPKKKVFLNPVEVFNPSIPEYKRKLYI
jgi:hypothetical protein